MTDDKSIRRRSRVAGRFWATAYVDGRHSVGRTASMRPIQRFLTENIWGDVWGRGTLTRGRAELPSHLRC